MAEINGVFIDDIPAKSIPRFKREVLKKDRDKYILIDGREGAGKSLLAMQWSKVLDPNFTIDKVAFNADQFIKLVKSPNRKKGDCILLDEAFSSASARSSLSHINKAMITVATEMRQLNLFVIIVLPSFFDLDKYFAIWRCDTLLHVYYNKKGNRGQYIIFPFRKKLKLYIKGKKTYNYSCVKSPYPACRFIKQWVVDQMAYRKKKMEAFIERKQSLMDKVWKERALKMMMFAKEKMHLTNKEIGELIGERKGNTDKMMEQWQLFGIKNEDILDLSIPDNDTLGGEPVLQNVVQHVKQ